MTLIDLVDEFKRSNPHWTPDTRRRVDNHLGLLVTLLGRDTEIAKLTKADMRRLRSLLQTVSSNATKRGVPLLGYPPFISTKTLNDCIVWIKSFWRWLELSYDEVTYNPTVALKSFPSSRAPSRDAISDTDLARWIEQADSRDALLISALSLTGARLGEVAMALPSDVDIVSKTFEHRLDATIRIAPNAVRPLKTVQSHRVLPIHSAIDPQALKEALPFTRTKSGLAILSKRLNRHLNKVVDNDRVCVHSLRHRFATKLKESGCEDSLVADILGHKLGTMTSRYAKVSSVERMREAVERVTLPSTISQPRAQISNVTSQLDNVSLCI